MTSSAPSRRGQEYLAVAIAFAGLSSIVSCWISPWNAWNIAKWSTAQWMPESISGQWQGEAWDYWEQIYQQQPASTDTILNIPTVNVQNFPDPADLLQHLEDTQGVDWRKRPLLLQGLWSAEELVQSTRRVSKAGLLKENLTIPYFRDARVEGALAPNEEAPLQDIVANITQRGAPHKIGTQFLIQTYPQLIHEVAPPAIVTALFGDHFQPKHVVGAFGLPFLPATTTVPLFVAGASSAPIKDDASKNNSNQHPFTALHCEPIGNVAVQLEGEKYWTLVSPEHSFLLQPSASPDGRAFFVSQRSIHSFGQQVPRYYATTRAGDALWIPTWTWHRVDYGSEKKSNGSIAIGASLFHLRPMELVTNNPLFAFLVVPALIKEVLGFNTQ